MTITPKRWAALTACAVALAAGTGPSAAGAATAGRGVTGQLIVRDAGSQRLPTAAERVLAGVEGVRVVSAIRRSPAHLVGTQQTLQVTGIDPGTIDAVLQPDWAAGSSATLSMLDGADVAVAKDWADAHHAHPGSTFELIAPPGARLTVTVRGVYEDPAAVLADVTIANYSLRSVFGMDRDTALMASVAPGANVDAVRQRAARAIDRRYPGAEVRTTDDVFKDGDAHTDWRSRFVYGLLALAGIAALLAAARVLAPRRKRSSSRS